MTLNTGTITSKHNSLIEAYTASLRCYYFTSVPSIFVQGSVFRVIWIELYNTPLKFVLKPLIYAWSFIVILPFDIMDASALILDTISVFKGFFTLAATLGYLAGFVARDWYREFYFPGY